ncbi:hypothetical protein COBT_002283, partial [Conglomerata obtusa]
HIYIVQTDASVTLWKEIGMHRDSLSRFIRKVTSVFIHIYRDELYGKLGKNLFGTIIEIDQT